MATITLDQWTEHLAKASRTLPAELRKMMIKGALYGEGEAKQNATNRGGPKVRSGRLRASIKGRAKGQGLDSQIVLSADTPYARTQEKGGTIRPVRKQWLTIPQEPAKTAAGVARGSARMFPGLHFVMSPDHPNKLAWLMDDEGTVFFTLVKKSVVKPHPYLKPAIDSTAKKLPAWCDEVVKRVVGVS